MPEVKLIIHGTNDYTFTYTNWRGETSQRHVRASSIWYGSTEWHPKPQWFLNALDLEKYEYRDFAMCDMTDVAVKP